MRYGIFMTMAAMPSITKMVFPVDVTILHQNGDMIKTKIDSQHWHPPHTSVAIQFHEPEPIDAETYRIQTILEREGVSVRNATVRRILELTGFSGTKGDATGEIARLPKSITNRLSSGQMDDLKSWLAGGGHRRIVGDLHSIVGNHILAVHKAFKGANNTGRVVVTPAGHSIAYTAAKEIWTDINRNAQYSWGHYSTGEYMRSDNINHASRRITYDRSRGHITIGCQTIPYNAFADLARREGW